MGFWDSVGKAAKEVGKHAQKSLDTMQSMRDKSDTELEKIIDSWSSSSFEKTSAKAELNRRNRER